MLNFGQIHHLGDLHYQVRLWQYEIGFGNGGIWTLTKKTINIIGLNLMVLNGASFFPFFFLFNWVFWKKF